MYPRILSSRIFSVHRDTHPIPSDSAGLYGGNPQVHQTEVRQACSIFPMSYAQFPLFRSLLRLLLLLRISYLSKDIKKSEHNNLGMGKYQFKKILVRQTGGRRRIRRTCLGHLLSKTRRRTRPCAFDQNIRSVLRNKETGFKTFDRLTEKIQTRRHSFTSQKTVKRRAFDPPQSENAGYRQPSDSAQQTAPARAIDPHLIVR